MSEKYTPQIGFYAFEQSYLEFPQRWYETTWFQWIASLGIPIPVWYLQTWLGLYPNLWLSIASVIIYIGGLLADSYATNLTLTLKSHFDKRGIEFPIWERSVLLPAYPTARDQLMTWGNIVEVGLAAGAYIFPSFGVLAGLLRANAVLGNLRQRKWLLQTLQLIDRETTQIFEDSSPVVHCKPTLRAEAGFFYATFCPQRTQ
jgi:hypothetical protein